MFFLLLKVLYDNINKKRVNYKVYKYIFTYYIIDSNLDEALSNKPKIYSCCYFLSFFKSNI